MFFLFAILLVTDKPEFGSDGEITDGDVDGLIDFLEVGDFLFQTGGLFELGDGNGVDLHDFSDGKLGYLVDLFFIFGFQMFNFYFF